MLTLELKNGWIYFSTNRREEIAIALQFLEEHKKIMDGAGTMERTVYDMQMKYDRIIK